MTELQERQNGTGPPAGPQLIHAGTYALYRTPAGGLHVAFSRRTVRDEESGQVMQVPEPVDEHLPEMPAAVVELMTQAAETGKRPTLPQIMRVMMGGGNGD